MGATMRWGKASIRGMLATLMLAGCVSFPSNFSAAQEATEPELRGLNKINFWAAPLDKSNERCGITESSLRQTFMYPASSAKFNVIDSPIADGYFTVFVTTDFGNGLCISTVITRVTTIQKVQFDYSGLQRASSVLLWSEHYIAYGPPNQHNEQIKKVLTNMTQSFITRWNLNNK